MSGGGRSAGSVEATERAKPRLPLPAIEGDAESGEA